MWLNFQVLEPLESAIFKVISSGSGFPLGMSRKHSTPYPQLMFPAFVGHLFPVTKGKLAGALQVLNFPIFPFFIRGTLGPPNPQADTSLPGNSVLLYLSFPFFLEEEMPFFF